MFRYKRRHLHEEHENLDRWLVSYADYMTLMFALFVVLYSLASVQQDDLRKFREALSELFRVEARDVVSDTGNQYSGRSLPDNLPELLNSANETLLAGDNQQSASSDELSHSELNVRQQGQDLQQLEQQLKQVLLDLLNSGDADMTLDHGWLVIRLSSGMLFPSGSASPQPRLASLIADIATPLQQGNNFIRVRGYTDDQRIHNELFNSNWQLSAARANAVLAALLDNAILPQRLATEAYGPNDPVASNQTEQGRAKNRRVEIAISQWAYVAPVTETEPAAAEQEDAGQTPQDASPSTAPQPLPDYEQIQVVPLKDGNIRITTRREQADEEEKP